MFAFAFDGGDQAQQLALVHAGRGDDLDHLGLAAGEGAGLVEDGGVEAGGLFERDRVLEQHAALGAKAGADHDRGRGGKAERVRTGDDDDMSVTISAMDVPACPP